MKRRQHPWMCALSGAVGLALVLGVGIGAPAAATTLLGHNDDARVIGGTPVEDGAYPFVAFVQRVGKHHCGGSLIAPTTVLTAAHCIREAGPDEFQVVVGRTILSGDNGQHRNVTDIRVHPNFDYDTQWSNDLALLTLDAPVLGITPVRLPEPGDDTLSRPGETALLTGWGFAEIGAPETPDHLQGTVLTLVSNTDCKAVYGDTFDLSLSICADAPNTVACHGDSGGPLFRTIDGVVSQIGSVSGGNPTCTPNGYPTVFTDLSSAELWDTFWSTPASITDNPTTERTLPRS